MGYRPLSLHAITRGLGTPVVGREVIVRRTIGSTNDWLKAAAQDGAAEGVAVFAEEQTSGRGQAGRIWLAPPGRCLLVSILLRPALPPDRLAYVTMIGATAAAAAIAAVTGQTVALKWPNDLIGKRGKLGGVLTEASLEEGRVQHAILGIGLNVNLSRGELARIPGADSLQVQLGRMVDRNLLAGALLRELDSRYASLSRGELDPIFDEWRDRLDTLGRAVTLRRDGDAEGPYLAQGVADTGALVLRRADGSTFEVLAGEVSARPIGCPESTVSRSGKDSAGSDRVS